MGSPAPCWGLLGAAWEVRGGALRASICSHRPSTSRRQAKSRRPGLTHHHCHLRLHWPQTNRHARHTAGPTCANNACHYDGLQRHSARDSSVLRKVIHASSSCACNHTPHPSHTLYLNTRGRPSEPHRAYRAHHNTHPLHAPAPRPRLNLNAHTYDNTR